MSQPLPDDRWTRCGAARGGLSGVACSPPDEDVRNLRVRSAEGVAIGGTVRVPPCKCHAYRPQWIEGSNIFHLIRTPAWH